MLNLQQALSQYLWLRFLPNILSSDIFEDILT